MPSRITALINTLLPCKLLNFFKYIFGQYLLETTEQKPPSKSRDHPGLGPSASMRCQMSALIYKSSRRASDTTFASLIFYYQFLLNCFSKL